ncbi:MAG TPA: rod shape-determining protein MreD [Bacteroidales bacterium]|jgi:rod shape-determining protein MreD|nr:rod shape-determining protein MreD [Bacteroidales bacterium]
MIKLFPRYLGSFILLVFVQVFILNNIQFSGYINPYIYVMFILVLPFETPNWLLLIFAFILGLTVDLFSSTVGMHSSATVFMAFLRPYVLKVISPRDGYESETLPQLRYYGISWFIRYSTILIVAHHLILFYIEVFRFSDFFATFVRVILSSIFTIILVLISQYFYRKDTKR